MKEIFIIKDCFDDSETILKFLKNKNCNVNLISNEELSNLEKINQLLFVHNISRKVLEVRLKY